MRVKVAEAKVTERNITRKRDGRQFTFREQSGLVDFPNGERRVIALSLDEGQSAYPVGEYTVLDSSFVVDQNGRLAIGRVHLSPVVSEAARKTA